jgi:hypothetical protein
MDTISNTLKNRECYFSNQEFVLDAVSCRHVAGRNLKYMTSVGISGDFVRRRLRLDPFLGVFYFYPKNKKAPLFCLYENAPLPSSCRDVDGH